MTFCSVDNPGHAYKDTYKLHNVCSFVETTITEEDELDENKKKKKKKKKIVEDASGKNTYNAVSYSLNLYESIIFDVCVL